MFLENGSFRYGAITHSYSQRLMPKVFLWINQSNIFILNWPISDVSNCNSLVWKDAIQKLCLAGIRTQRRVLRVERIFMAPEFESTSRKDAITLFSISNANVGSNFESRNLISLIQDRPISMRMKGKRRGP